jgi:hypothetical protein
MLNWMGGSQSGINAVDPVLQKVDPAGNQDKGARELHPLAAEIGSNR